MSQPADRNLLFGVLALQMDFIKREQLIAAMQAWVFDKSKPLGQILVAQKALAEDNHALLEALVRKHLALHDNDAEKSLAAVSSVGSVKKDLERIADQDVQASLVHVAAAPARPEDQYATVAPDAGMTLDPRMRFRILRPHAKGGLGEVFVAQDQELHREVALKEIQERQADNKESRARFLVEAEITGGLEHPGIVPVYGLGVYADGRPYYAMRFIRGDSLKEAIERFHKADAAGMDAGQRVLELRALLGRFVDVCNAIGYAHSRGVLHRDLKPSNIMLGKYGETLVVDWGLAKPMGEMQDKTKSLEPGEGSLIPHSITASSQTVMGSALGTPQYMSPEQAAGRHDQLGPPSDVYSLGATLYCLLTGQPPFNERDVGTVLQKVKRGDFPKPRAVKPSVPLPLEAICCKAMAVNAADRYPTARQLADDLEHWLADEPVTAWPEPWTVKARRWIGRNRTLVTGVAAAVMVALVGLLVATVLLNAAKERETAAKELAEEQKREAVKQKDIAEEQKREAVKQKENAERNFQLARQAVDRYHTEVSQDQLLNEPGMQPLRKKLLEAAHEFYDKFVKERAGDQAVQGELGRATFRLAQITGEIDSELDAIKLHQAAVKIFEALPTAQESADTKTDLAACYHHLGRLYRLTDQLKASEESYKKALAQWESLLKDQPKDERLRDGLARTQLGLGNLYQLRRDRQAAQSNYQLALNNWNSLHGANAKTVSYRRDLAVTQNNLGILLKVLGNKADGEKMLRAAQTLQKQLVLEFSNISQYQNDLAKTERNLGEYEKAAELWQTLVKNQPPLTDPHKTLADVYSDLVLLHLRANDAKKAEDAAQKAVAIRRKLMASHVGVPSYQGDLGSSLSILGDVYLSNSDPAQAKSAFDEAAGIQEKLVRDLPDVPHYQRDLALSYTRLGDRFLSEKRLDKADDVLKKALGIWDTLLKDRDTEKDYQYGKSDTCIELGNLAGAIGDLTNAAVWFNRALKLAPESRKSEIKQALSKLPSN